VGIFSLMESRNLKLFFVISNQSYLDLQLLQIQIYCCRANDVVPIISHKLKIISLLLSAVQLYWNMVQVKFVDLNEVFIICHVDPTFLYRFYKIWII